MRFAPGRVPARTAFLALSLSLAVGQVGCGNILDVDDPDVVTPEQLSGPDAIPIVINGVFGAWREALDDMVLVGGLFTDEFILGGTSPNRLEVDDRQITVNNGTVTEILMAARFQADQGIVAVESAQGDSDADPALVTEGLAVTRTFAGYTRILLAEFFCHSILGGGDEEAPASESAAILPDDRMRQAFSLLQEGEQAAREAGRADLENVARIGRARARLWLRDFDRAAQIAAQVPTDFVFLTEFSSNTRAEDNEVYLRTWGVIDVIRWTVGDGSDPGRKNEAWPYFDEWVEQGLILTADQHTRQTFNRASPAHLQTLYSPASGGQDADILMASGWEARMIEAEAALRAGDAGGAAAIIDPLLADPSLNPMRSVNPEVPAGAFRPVQFTGDLQNDLSELARARAAGLWLTGERLGTLRRFLADGVDLFPNPVQGRGRGSGDDTALPMPQQEIDNNPDLGSACPSGPPWR